MKRQPSIGVLLLLLAGCVGPNRESAVPVTQVDPAQANIAYWLARPAVAGASDPDFFRLWAACESAARDRFFKIDREDQRSGLLTTEAMISKQFFELWRTDVVSPSDVLRSSLATQRRTLRFEIARSEGHGFIVRPKVVIEQQAVAEKEIPSAAEYTRALGGTRVIGDRASDAGQGIPQDYWYAVGRDHALEKDLARGITARLASR